MRGLRTSILKDRREAGNRVAFKASAPEVPVHPDREETGLGL
jgi:hypothetical protein